MDETPYEFKSEFNDRYNLVTRKLVRMLSQDARISTSNLSKALGISRKTVHDRLLKVDAEFGIRYTIELNENLVKLSSPHLVVVKFDSKPDYEHVTELLKSSYIPQLAIATKGKYDLIIFAAATSSKQYAHWDKSMQILLQKYGADWHSSEVVHRQLAFFPLRNELIERLEIEPKYKEMIKLLNVNGRSSFKHISDTLGMHFNTVAYNFNKLLKMNYIKRFTITMNKPPNATLMSFFSKYRPSEGYENRSALARKAFMSDDEYSLISRYLMCAPLIGSFDFFTLGAFDNFDTAYKKDILYHKKIFVKDKIKIEYGEVERVLLGQLPIRSIDTMSEYNTIKWAADFQE